MSPEEIELAVMDDWDSEYEEERYRLMDEYGQALREWAQ